MKNLFEKSNSIWGLRSLTKSTHFGFVFILAFFATNINALPLSSYKCQQIASERDSTLEKCETVHVITLRGNPTDRAKTHGVFYKKYLSHEVFDYFSERLFREFDSKSYFIKKPIQSLYNLWVHKYFSYAPENIKNELYSFADAADIDHTTMQRAWALPDTSMNLYALKEKYSLDFGCTTVARKSKDGNFVQGRNLDFSGVFVFDQHPAIIIHLPKEGSDELKHISFGADGIHFSGITGVNEAGITFSVHQMLSKEAGPFGTPMLLIGELVLRQARTLDQAVEIIRSHRPGPLWTFIISDLNQKQAWTVEASNKNFAVRKMNSDILAQANHLLVADRSDEVASVGWIANSQFRMEKALQIISKNQNTVLAQDAAKVLSYQDHPAGEFSVSRDIIKGETIQSVIFENSKNKTQVYFAFESAPVASGKYLQFQLNDFFSSSSVKSYKIQDLANVSEENRKKQLLLTKASYLKEWHQEFESSKLFQGQKSFESTLYQAFGLYRDKQWTESLALLRNLPHETGLPAQVVQSAEMLKILNYLQLKKDDEAKKIVKDLQTQKIFDPKFQILLSKIRDEKSLNKSDLKVHYSLFSGYLEK